MRCALIGSVFLALAAAAAARGEVFVLKDGGRVVGELLNPEQSPRTTFVIRTPTGGEVSLERAQVEQVLHLRAEELEYERVRPSYPDTVEGQWALARWCQENKLAAARETHLQRVIELEPGHEEARRALGYFLRNGQWLTQEEAMARDGYRRYKGKWMNEQQIQLAESRRQQELAEKDWFRKVNQWRDWLGTERHPLGLQNLTTIDDPAAVKALAAALDEDPRASARRVYVDALAHVGGPAAAEVLTVTAMEDPELEVRLTCLDWLKTTRDPAVVAYFVRGLKHKNNAFVRRAAVGLSAMRDPSAIGPLIDALVTEHKFAAPGSGGGGPGSISTTFGSGGGGMAVGGGPKVIRQQFRNAECLDALVLLTGGANFQYDVSAWKSWYAARKRQITLEATSTAP